MGRIVLGLGVLLAAPSSVWAQLRVSAPFVEIFEDSGGVSIRAPFVSVDTGRFGTQVRAPFTDVRTGAFGVSSGRGTNVVVEVGSGVSVLVQSPSRSAVRPVPLPRQGETALPRERGAAYLVIPQTHGQRVRVLPDPNLAKPSHPSKQLHELTPIRHTDLPHFFRPRRGIHVFAFVHPYTKRAVVVEVTLPRGNPRLKVRRDRIKFDYGEEEVEIEFEKDGRTTVDYDD